MTLLLVQGEEEVVVADDDLAWQRYGACVGIGPELFFPESETIARARQICAACVVRSECLEYALTHNEKYGVWGGKSERERRKMQRRMRLEVRSA